MTTTTTPNIDQAAISEACAILQANLPTLRAYLPPPRDVARQIQEIAAAKQLEIKIDWRWVGRERHGVVSIVNKDGNATFSTIYKRSSGLWDESDTLLTSCNTGSPKHRALIAVLAYLNTLPKRRCGGISDTLVR